MNHLQCFSKPFLAWSEEERKQLPNLIQAILDSGVKIVLLGQKRCFFCGSPISSETAGDSKTITNHKGNGLVIMNLCDDCWDNLE